jgi:hypothetical protein
MNGPSIEEEEPTHGEEDIFKHTFVDVLENKK